MSKSDTLETGFLALLLNATPLSQIADNASSSAATDLWMSLHTDDPGDDGTQGSNEASYSGYTRIATTRSTAGWTVSAGAANPVSAVTFPQAASTSTSTITHAAIGLTSVSTAGAIFYKGALDAPIHIGQNVTPSLSTGTQIAED